MAQKRGLGRGIGALIGDETTPDVDIREAMAKSRDPERVVSRETMELPIILIDNNPDQPRRNFDDESLSDLAESLKLYGMIQPIAVKPGAGGRYTIISGERRWRAAKLAKLSTVPVVIRDVEDKTLLEMALVENIQRVDLNPIESAFSMNTLMEEYGLTQLQLSERLSKSRSAVANTLRLLKLAPAVQQLVRDGRLTEGQARPLVGLDAEQQKKLADEIIQRKLSSRQVEELVKSLTAEVKKKKPRERITDPDLLLLESLFRDTLGCKVKAQGTPNRGSITLSYFTRTDLEKIYDALTSIQQENNI